MINLKSNTNWTRIQTRWGSTRLQQVCQSLMETVLHHQVFICVHLQQKHDQWIKNVAADVQLFCLCNQMKLSTVFVRQAETAQRRKTLLLFDCGNVVIFPVIVWLFELLLDRRSLLGECVMQAGQWARGTWVYGFLQIVQLWLSARHTMSHYLKSAKSCIQSSSHQTGM